MPSMEPKVPDTILEYLCQEIGIPYTAEHRAFEDDLHKLRQLGETARLASYINTIDQRYAPHTPDPSLFERQYGGISATSIPSEHHPERNEDAYFILECNGARIIGVFDGLGGHPGSEVASEVAAKTCKDLIESLTIGTLPPDAATMLLRQALSLANAAIKRENQLVEQHDLPLATTAAMASIHAHPDTGAPYVAMAWVGDSRIYIVEDGEVVYSTLDDNIKPFWLAREKNLLSPRALQDFLETVDVFDFYENKQLYNAFHHRSSVANCLDGHKNLLINTDTYRLTPGAKVLGVSDGICDNLTRSEIGACTSVDELVARALERSRDEDHLRSKPDDITAAEIIV